MGVIKRGQIDDLNGSDFIAPDELFQQDADGTGGGSFDYFSEISRSLAEMRQSPVVVETIAFEVVKSALKRVLGILGSDELIAACIRQAAASPELASAIKAHVCPADFPVASRAFAEHFPGVEVSPDALLTNGEIILETAMGRVQLGARQQIAHMLEDFG